MPHPRLRIAPAPDASSGRARPRVGLRTPCSLHSHPAVRAAVISALASSRAGTFARATNENAPAATRAFSIDNRSSHRM